MSRALMQRAARWWRSAAADAVFDVAGAVVAIGSVVAVLHLVGTFDAAYERIDRATRIAIEAAAPGSGARAAGIVRAGE